MLYIKHRMTQVWGGKINRKIYDIYRKTKSIPFFASKLSAAEGVGAGTVLQSLRAEQDDRLGANDYVAWDDNLINIL